LSNKELAELTGVSAVTSRTTLLSLAAAREALSDSAIQYFFLANRFVSGNTVGSMDKAKIFY